MMRLTLSTSTAATLVAYASLPLGLGSSVCNVLQLEVFQVGTRTHARTPAHAHTCTHTHTFARAHTHARARTHTHKHAHQVGVEVADIPGGCRQTGARHHLLVRCIMVDEPHVRARACQTSYSRARSPLSRFTSVSRARLLSLSTNRSAPLSVCRLTSG